jgi:hypothetical protein
VYRVDVRVPVEFWPGLVLEILVRRLVGHVDAVAVQVELPARADTADIAIFVTI